MADKHPYVSSVGGLGKTLSHFRRSFPSSVTANTLEKLGYAPKNESYLLNVLLYIGLVDKEGNRTAAAGEAFTQHDDIAFAKKFATIVKEAYSDIFDLHGDSTWELDKNDLITFFRSSGQTSNVVGIRQANTFQMLAAFAGHGEIPEVRSRTSKADKSAKTAKVKKKTKTKDAQESRNKNGLGHVVTGESDRLPKVGLTVRIEINLPADGDRKTYDQIFASIRENLLND